jgi:hypothetical protein
MPEPVLKRTLSEDLRSLLPKDPGINVPIQHVFNVMVGRGYALLILFFSFPFLLPLPLPGLSVPFGVIIALFGLRLTLAQKPWLPQALLRRNIQYTTLSALVDKGVWLASKVEKVLKPRLLFLSASEYHFRVHGVLFVCMGIVLALPLPPGTNFPPAFSIVLLCLGMMERDGYFIVASYLVGIATPILFAFIGVGLYKAVLGSCHIILGG